VAFVWKLDGLKTFRDDTPVRSEIGIYLVIFVWELNVVFLDVSPPFIEAWWRCS
jgi:hypothetical protein